MSAMRRTERLFAIIQILRRARAPVTAQSVADELETSLRTVYRDVAQLIAQRVPVRGELVPGPGPYEIEVLDADPRRVKKLRIYRSADRRNGRAHDAPRRIPDTTAPTLLASPAGEASLPSETPAKPAGDAAPPKTPRPS